MKQLNLLVIRAYLGPFVLTFFISLFVLVMQFLWKYVDQLAGKGLEPALVLELIFYASATLVPMALPLAILLSSIMTLGSLAENLELVAAKASGISLLKLMRPLIVIAMMTSACAFLFANYGMPVASFKLNSLLSAIRRTKPAIDIQEGVFYDGIKGLVIYVQDKGEDQKTFFNTMIYDHSDNMNGAGSITMARRGIIGIYANDRYLSFKLFEGVRYDDRNFYTREQEGYPLFREFFKEQEIIIDLSEFKVDRENSGNLSRNQYTMMNVAQLQQVKKTLSDDLDHYKEAFTRSIRQRYMFEKPPVVPVENAENSTVANDMKIGFSDPNTNVDRVKNIARDTTLAFRRIESISFAGGKFLDTYTAAECQKIVALAEKRAAGFKEDLSGQKSTLKNKTAQISKNEVEWHRKFSLSFACIMLFFVGAPLGAIIRKGGLGLPLIFCIVIFIIYYVTSTIGEKAAKQLTLSPFEGMWLSAFIFFPVGIFLTLKASSESPIFVAENYVNFFKRVFRRK